MLRQLLLFLVLLHVACCACPNGFDLVCDGQCRGFFSDYDVTPSKMVQIAKDFCGGFHLSLPVIIHNEEQQAYWKGKVRREYVFALGLVCNTQTDKWEWVDGTAVDYKPTKYNSSLDEPCISLLKPGASWILKGTEEMEWDILKQHNGMGYTTDINCIKQLEPLPSESDCEYSGDEHANCYQVVQSIGTWKDSEKACQTLRGTPASVHNAKDNSFIRRLAVSHGAINGLYIGANATESQDEYKWVDGSKWDYENFHPGFPQSGHGDCLAMDTSSTSGEWMNMNCNSKLAVACEQSRDPAVYKCNPGPWKEGQIIYSPGFPYVASEPCDYYLTVAQGKRVRVEVILLEANSCCDRLILTDNYLGGNIVANLTGEISNKSYETQFASANFMRVSWQPNGGVNVRGMMLKFSTI